MTLASHACDCTKTFQWISCKECNARLGIMDELYEPNIPKK